MDLDHCRAAAVVGARRALASFRTDIEAESKDGGVDSVTEADRAAQREVIERIGAAFPDETVVGEEDDASKSVPAEGPAWVVDPIDGTNNYVAGRRVWATSVARVVDGEPVAAATAAPALGDVYLADTETAWREPYRQSVAAVDERSGDPAAVEQPAEADVSQRGRLAVASESDPEQFFVNPLFGVDERHRRECRGVVETVLASFGDLRRLGCAQLVLAGVAAGQLHAAVSTVELNDWDTIAGVHLVRLAGGRVTDTAGDRWVPGATGLVASNGEAHDALLSTVTSAPESD